MRSRRIAIVKAPGVIGPLVMRSYERALRALGHQVVTLTLPSDTLVGDLSAVVRFKPELALSYGYSGFIYDERGPFFRRIGVPLALLHYDCPFFGLEEPLRQEFGSHGPAYTHFIWDQAFHLPYAKLGMRTFPILLAADPEVFKPRAPSYRFQASFVGHGGDPQEVRIKRQERLTPELNAFVDEVIEAKASKPWVPTLEHWAEVCRAYHLDRMMPDWSQPGFSVLYNMVHAEATMHVRRRAMAAIHCVRPDAYGRGWESIPSVVPHAAVDYTTELPGVYADTRVNVNVTSVQLEHSLNNRIFDVAAVGGFVLCDYRSDLAQVFPDYERITWRTYEELNEKVAWFLAHETERLELADALHKAVLARHTYAHRARYVLESMGLG